MQIDDIFKRLVDAELDIRKDEIPGKLKTLNLKPETVTEQMLDQMIADGVLGEVTKKSGKGKTAGIAKQEPPAPPVVQPDANGNGAIAKPETSAMTTPDPEEIPIDLNIADLAGTAMQEAEQVGVGMILDLHQGLEKIAGAVVQQYRSAPSLLVKKIHRHIGNPNPAATVSSALQTDAAAWDAVVNRVMSVGSNL